MTTKSEKYRGRWWLADVPETSATGVLTIDADGTLELELSGALGDESLREDFQEFSRHTRRIVGQLENFSHVSLDGCFLRKDDCYSQMPTQLWHAHEAIFGAAFSAEEPWAFYGARFWFPGLTRWVRWQGTEALEEFNEDGSPRRIGVTASLSTWPLWTTGECDVDLVARVGSHRRSEIATELESVVLLRVRNSQLLDRHELHDIAIRPLQAILGLATGEYIGSVQAEVTVSGTTAGERITRLPWRRVVAKGNLDPERAKYAFLYQDLSEQVRTSATPPFASLAPVLDLYLASLRELSYAEFSFNVVVQALETYHRCRHEGHLLPPDQWAPLKNHLLQTIDATLANTEPHARLALTQRLEYFNELGLRQRVRALLASVAPNADAVCGGNAKSFVNAVVQTRNYFTHWDPSLQVSAFRGGSLVYLTYRLRGLLEILLLRELGFAPNSAAERAILQRRVSWLPE